MEGRTILSDCDQARSSLFSTRAPRLDLAHSTSFHTSRRKTAEIVPIFYVMRVPRVLTSSYLRHFTTRASRTCISSDKTEMPADFGAESEVPDMFALVSRKLKLVNIYFVQQSHGCSNRQVGSCLV